MRLRDAARVEIAGESYKFASRLNGKPSSAICIQCSPRGNALTTSQGVNAVMTELERHFPTGLKDEIPYDNSTFVKIASE